MSPNVHKHWVRVATACTNDCVFCLDSDTPRGRFTPVDEVEADLARGRREGAEHAVLSGGEATLHPRFADLVRHARAIGYERVQVITNGGRFADRAFYEAAIQAGLGEITFSLHGDTADLHDALTRTPGSFDRLLKGLLRALRDDDGPIVNVDICVNRQNVDRLDRIVELCASLGVTEFDLLHVVPHGSAYVHRDRLFYDPREHLPALHKVLALNRLGRFHIWTNRFPPAYLEGMEQHIQDPHKLLDEVSGRRLAYRRYLDQGRALECREPERCAACFVAPFCDTVDRVAQGLGEGAFEVWQVDSLADLSHPLPFGCTRLGLSVDRLAELDLVPPGLPVEVRVRHPEPLQPASRPMRLLAEAPAALDAWLADPMPDGVEVQVTLDRHTGRWLLTHRDLLAQHAPRLSLHQPGHEDLEEAERDLRDLPQFFWSLDLPLPTSGLPPCLAPGMPLVEPVRRLPASLFDPTTGRLSLTALATHHLTHANRTHSLRCGECVVRDRCPGIHLNMARAQGFSILCPLRAGPYADAAREQVKALAPRVGVVQGLPPVRPHPGLGQG